MPLASNRTLHSLIKHNRSAEEMPTDPNERDLLGFPGVEAEHPKAYLRRLWLPAENDRTTYPKFHDTDIIEMAKLASRVVNSLTNDVAKLNEELQGGAFLKAEANWILEDKGYGRRIWGEDCGANARLKSNLGGTYPRWGAMTACGEHIENDQKMIKLTFRHWMAVRLQNKIKAPSRETRRLAETNSKRQGGPESYQGEGARDVLLHHDSSPSHSPDGGTALATVQARLEAKDNEGGHGVASDSSAQKPSFIDVEPSQDQHSLKRKRSNASEAINMERRLHPLEFRGAAYHGSPDLIDPTDAWKQIAITKASPTSATPSHAYPAASTPTNRTAMVSKVEHEASRGTHHNFSECEAPATNVGIQRSLHDLLADDRLNLEVMSSEMIAAAWDLYRQSPQRQPYDDWYNDFRVLSQALDRWEGLVARESTAADIMRPSSEDPLPKFTAKKTAEDRLRVYRGSRSQMQPPFSFDTWTIALGLLFEGLLPDVGIPSSFEDTVVRLRTLNRPLFNLFLQ